MSETSESISLQAANGGVVSGVQKDLEDIRVLQARGISSMDELNGAPAKILRDHSYRHDAADIWPKLLKMIACGMPLSKALEQIKPFPPSYNWARTCLNKDPDLMNRYRQAKVDRGEKFADDIWGIANETMPEGLDSAGKGAWINQLKLRVDTAKWVASRLNPDYGDSMKIDLTSTKISITAALDMAERRVSNVIEHEPKVAILPEIIEEKIKEAVSKDILDAMDE